MNGIAKTSKRALVGDLGVTGAAALRLHQAGWEPVVIERAPHRRTDGHFIAMWASDYAAAERLGTLPGIRKHTPYGNKTYNVTRSDRHKLEAGVNAVSGLVPGRQRADEVLGALRAGGADPSDVVVLHGQEGVRILDSDGTEHGWHAKLVRFFQNWGYDNAVLCCNDTRDTRSATSGCGPRSHSAGRNRTDASQS